MQKHIDFSLSPVAALFCRPTDLQVVVVVVGVNLVARVYVEHRVQAFGGAGVLFELLHLDKEIHKQGGARAREAKGEVEAEEKREREK